MKQNFLDKAIRIISGDCAYDSDGKTILVWKTPDVEEPSQADIDAKIVELTEEYEAQEYARNRQAEYPSIADLVVALYDTDDKSAIEAKRASVKLKYPKP